MSPKLSETQSTISIPVSHPLAATWSREQLHTLLMWGMHGTLRLCACGLYVYVYVFCTYTCVMVYVLMLCIWVCMLNLTELLAQAHTHTQIVNAFRHAEQERQRE